MMPPYKDVCILEIPEWTKQTFELPGDRLCVEDRQLLAELSKDSDCRVEIDELRNGLCIRTRSWVGVIRLHSVEIRILPKLDEGKLSLVELIDYAHGIDALKRKSAYATLSASGASLFDLIALLFAESVEKVLRLGLLCDYSEMEDDLGVLRGRLLSEKQFLKRFGQFDRLECRFDEYHSEIIENQIVLAALARCVRAVVDPMVSLKVRRLFALFSEACTLQAIDTEAARSALTYHRMNAYYRKAHDFAFLLLGGLGVDDLFSHSGLRSYAFLIDMNALFQKFVARWIRQITQAHGYRLSTQQGDNTILWNAHKEAPYTRIIPDLLVERITRPGVFLPIDAKYKLYDDKNLSSGDIYQTFLYAFAYGESHALLPTSLVVYPASAEEERDMHVHVRQSKGLKTSAQVRGAAIHIPNALAEARGQGGHIAHRLLSLIEEVFDESSRLGADGRGSVSNH